MALCSKCNNKGVKDFEIKKFQKLSRFFRVTQFDGLFAGHRIHKQNIFTKKIPYYRK